MKIKTLTLGILTAIAAFDSLADSSKFQTDENGFARAPAEFSGFTITAVTHCDRSATEANRSIRALASTLEAILIRFNDPTVEEGIQSFPGTATPGDLVKYQNGVPVTICKGWRANHSYFFKLSRITDIPVFQDTVLELNPEDNSRVEVSLSAPKPGIFSQTYERLVDAALKDAHQKAVRRVRVLLEDMPQFTTFTLAKVSSSLTPSGSVAYDQTGLGGDPHLSALSSVHVSITRSFQFDLR